MKCVVFQEKLQASSACCFFLKQNTTTIRVKEMLVIKVKWSKMENKFYEYMIYTLIVNGKLF
jgi:hypothetical protein